jgi:hypothetical protein
MAPQRKAPPFDLVVGVRFAPRPSAKVHATVAENARSSGPRLGPYGRPKMARSVFSCVRNRENCRCAVSLALPADLGHSAVAGGVLTPAGIDSQQDI